ncbi:MAG: MFS transporter [Candidatus Nanohaloarchaeota archaeon QJJ-5]|nr:MFS transporter [Candidatus Nanohaloarchaeota archaeon QJJ-5]
MIAQTRTLFFPEDELHRVYLHRFLFRLAMQSVAMFLPLYIYQLEQSITQVLVFFIIYLGMFLFSFQTGAIVSRLGFKHTSLIASPLLLIFYLWLRMLDSFGPEALVVAFIGGLGFNMYWMGMNPEMARTSDSDNRDAETAIFYSLPEAAAAISPFVGGVLIAWAGFPVLFIAAAVTMFLSFLPLLKTDEYYDGMDDTARSFFSKKYLGDIIMFCFQGLQYNAKLVFWPLTLAVVIGGSVNIGGAGSLMAVGSMIASLTIGKLLDENSRPWIMGVGAGILVLSWAGMAVVTSPLFAFAVSFVAGSMIFAIDIPVYSLALDRAEESDIIEYLALREVMLAVGRLIGLVGALVALRYVAPGQLIPVLFGLVAVGTLGTLGVFRTITS